MVKLHRIPCQVSERSEEPKVGCDRRTYSVGNGTESRVGIVRGAIRSRYTRRHLRNGVPVPYKQVRTRNTGTTTNRRIHDALRILAWDPFEQLHRLAFGKTIVQRRHTTRFYFPRVCKFLYCAANDLKTRLMRVYFYNAYAWRYNM